MVASVARWDEYSRMLWIHEQMCQEFSQIIKYLSERQEQLLAILERKKSLLREAPDDLRKRMFQEIRELDDRISGRNAQMEEGREKLVAKGGVTRIASSGSQTSEMEAELLSADADDRVQLLLEVFSHRRQWRRPPMVKEEGRKVSSVDEEVNQVQGSMGIEEEDVHKSEMEEDFVMCEQIEEFGGERSPTRIKAPP